MAQQKKLFEQAEKWWQTDTAKAIATVAAVLLIPAAVIVYNYASNKEMEIGDENAENSEKVEDSISDDENSLESVLNGIIEKNEEEPVKTEEPAETDGTESDNQVGGLEEVKTLPNTSSK